MRGASCRTEEEWPSSRRLFSVRCLVSLLGLQRTGSSAISTASLCQGQGGKPCKAGALTRKRKLGALERLCRRSGGTRIIDNKNLQACKGGGPGRRLGRLALGRGVTGLWFCRHISPLGKPVMIESQGVERGPCARKGWREGERLEQRLKHTGNPVASAAFRYHQSNNTEGAGGPTAANSMPCKGASASCMVVRQAACLQAFENAPMSAGRSDRWGDWRGEDIQTRTLAAAPLAAWAGPQTQ